MNGQSLPSFVQGQYPSPGATGVALNSAIAIRFSLPFNAYAAKFTLRQKTGANIPLNQDYGWVDGASWDFVHRPSAVLAPATTYTFAVTASPLSYQFDFTTGAGLDSTGPRLVATTPEAAAKDISPFGPFTFRFDKELVSPPLAIAVTDGAGSGVGEVAVKLSVDRRSIEVRPQLSYRVAPIVQIRLDPAGVRDLAGNRGTGSPLTARFLTPLLKDSHGPLLRGQFPEMGEANIPTNAMVQLLFDRALFEPSIRDGGIVLEADGVNVPFQPQVSDSLVRLAGVTLRPNTLYRVRVTPRLLDANGVAVETESASEFTTAAAPEPDPLNNTITGPQFASLAPVNAQLVMRSARRLPSFTPLLFSNILPPRDGIQAFSERAVSARLLDDGKTLVLVPREPLPAWANIGVDLSAAFDITGGQFTSGLSFHTSDETDTQAPSLVAATPADGADGVPVSTVLRFVLNEPVGLMTPASGVRVSRDGEAIPGRLIFAPANDYSGNGPGTNAFDFKPASPLQPGADYEVDLAGVLDVAGNAMPPQTIRFRTAGDSTPPSAYTRLVRTNVESGNRDVQETLLFEYSSALKPGHTLVTVSLSVPRQYDFPLVFPHPTRTEVSGSTVNVVPLVPWPADRDLTLDLRGEDLWGRQIYYRGTFRTGGSADNTRPEVVSITPPGGTPISAGQSIRIVFSKAMLNASQTNGGLVASQMDSSPSPPTYWSEDRTTATMVPFLANYRAQITIRPLTVAATSALVDLAGNPLKAFTAVFPVIADNFRSLGLPQVVKTWPDSSDRAADRRTPITLYLSAAVDAAQLNHSIWVVTPNGRAAGAWQVSAGGRLAVFRPDAPWPASSTIRLFQIEPVLAWNYGYFFITAPPDPAVLTVVRSSIHDPHPANAVIDVEFSEDIPMGVSPLLLLVGNFQKVEVPCDEFRPRPRVLRLVPRSPLPAGDYLQLAARAGVNVALSSWSAKIGAPISLPTAALRYQAPPAGADAVPISARVSLVFSSQLNDVSVTDATIHLMSGGKQLPFRLVAPAPSARLTIAPLEPLPADQTIEVKIDGVEDRLGRRLPPLTWSFRTGSSIDTTDPSLLYSNASAAMDPLAPLVLTFDKPLDPVSIDALAADNILKLVWELSPDLRMVSFRKPGGWNRGESYDLHLAGLSDLSGNFWSTSGARFAVGFDPDRTPPVLRAVSLQDGQTGVPLNVTFSLLFNKPLGQEAMRTIRLAGGGKDVPLLFKASTGNRITLGPVFFLDPLTSYQLVIDGVRDASGNVLAGRSAISFTTGEQLNESLINAVFRFTSVSEPLRVQFSQPVDTTSLMDATGILSWIDRRGGGGYVRTVPANITWSDDRRAITVTPAQPLSVGVEYTLSLNGTTGPAGGAVAPGEFRFTPVDSPDRTPTRVTIVPSDTSTDVPLNVKMTVAFSRQVRVPAISLFEDDAPVNLTPAPFINNGFNTSASAELTPQRALKPNRRYRIEVGGFRDEFDNDIAPTTSSFTTGTQTASAKLTLLSSSPATGEAGVDPARPWILTFSNPLLPFVFLEPGLQTSRGIPYRSTIQTEGPRLTLRADPAWPAASLVTLTIIPVTHFGPAEILDWSGGRLSQQITLNFRTAAVNDPIPPVLESAVPSTGTTIPGGKASISLHFSKPVAIPADALQVFFGAEKTFAYGVLSQDFRTVTYNFLPPANSRVTIVGTDGIRDNADNSIAPFVLEYPTGENLPFGPPTAKLTEPDRYLDVPADTNVTVRFDRVMDPVSVVSAIRLTQDGANVSGSMEVLEDGRSYRFHPSAPFRAGALVKVFILPSATDPDGQAFRPDTLGLNFFVAGTAAGTLAITQRGFHQTAPADSTLELEFSTDLDAGTVNGSSVWLRRGTQMVSGQAALRDSRIVQFKPDAPLEPGVEYVLTAGSALRAIDGGTFKGQDLRFRAAPTSEPAEVESVTETEWEGQMAILVRFTRAVSPLAARGIRLERQWNAVDTTTRSSTSEREFLLIPRQAGPPGEFTVAIENAPDANGRRMAFRRVSVDHARSPR